MLRKGKYFSYVLLASLRVKRKISLCNCFKLHKLGVLLRSLVRGNLGKSFKALAESSELGESAKAIGDDVLAVSCKSTVDDDVSERDLTSNEPLLWS